MSFFAKFFHFLKNCHPIRNFAKPISRQYEMQSVTMPTNFVSVPISYEAIKSEVVETPHVSEYQETSTYSFKDSFHTFQPVESEAEKEMHGEEEVAAPVVVVRKLQVRPEDSLILEPTVEEPLAPDTVIGDIIDLSQYQTEPEVEEVEAEAQESAVSETEEVIGTVSIEVPVEKPKRTRKAATKAPAKKETKTTKAKAAVSKTKKTVKKTTAKKAPTKRKSSTPKEAMGFGF